MDGKFSLNDRLILPRLAVHSQNFIFDLQRFELTVLEAGEKIPEDAIFSCKLKETNEEGTEVEVTKYSKEVADFTTEKLGNATAITLLQSFNAPEGTAPDKLKTPTPGLTLSNSCVFDLNGCTLTFDDKTAIGIQVANGTAADAESGTEAVYNILTLKDSKTGGKILCNWDPNTTQTLAYEKAASQTDTDIGHVTASKVYAAINVGMVYDNSKVSNNYADSYTKLVVEGGTIESQSTAICASQATEVTINDGTIQSTKSSGIYFGNKCDGGGKLTVNGGTITAGTSSSQPAIQVSGFYGYGVSGVADNNYRSTEININGGKVAYTNSTNIFDSENGKAIGDPVAIYASGTTKLNITGGTIESTGTGVEIKNGEIEVTGGTVTSTATNYDVSSANTNGVTSFGAAIAVSTKWTDVSVKISGDSTKLSGANALAIANPIASKNTIAATIDGGTLTSSASTTSSDDRVGNAVLADNSNVVLTVNNGNLGGNVTVAKNEGGTQNKATIIVAGGTTTGEVKVVAVTGEGGSKTTSKVDFSDTSDEGKEAQANAKTALKVVGGKVSNSSSSKNFVAEGYEVKDDGSVGEDPTYTRTWKKQSDSDDTKFVFGLAGSGDSFSSIVAATVGTAVTNTNVFKYDSANFLFALPGLNNFSSVSLISDDARTYKFAGYSLAADSKTVTITPLNSGVKITSLAGGLLNSTITKLEIAENDTLGAYVDATNNNLSYMKGGNGQNTLIAGARKTTLEGGENANTLEGGDDVDTFLYTVGGNDVIKNYTYGTDIVSLSGSNDAPPTDFTNAAYNGSDFIFTLGGKTLQFKGSSQVQLLHKNTANGTDTYTYNEKSSIAKEGDGITLGVGFTGKSYDGSDKGYGTIDARSVTVSGGLKISARDDNTGGTVIGAQGGGTLLGGTGSDLLQSSVTADGSKLTLDGGAYGDDSLVGNQNADNLFIYRGGADSISGLDASKDIVRLMGNDYAPGKASVLTVASDANNNLILNFEGKDAISISGGAAAGFGPVSVQSGTRKGYYLFSKDQISYDKGVTLTSYYEAQDGDSYKTFDGTAEGNTDYATINAAAVTPADGATTAISIVGNANNNYIIGGLSGGNSLDGGATGNDTLVGGTVGSDLFYYKGGKDFIGNFKADDSISSDRIGEITTAKATSSKLTFTINKKSDELTFNFGDGDAIEKVSLQGGGYLTKDGKVKDKSLTLFSSAKKTIDITNDTLYSEAEIATVDAEAVTKQGVTLVGGEGGLYKFNGSNKQKDGFTYGGGTVSITGYEGGRDRIDFGTYSYNGFSINGNDVVLNLASVAGSSISIASAKDAEVLLRENNKNSKLVFKDNGVLENKAKNPTMATVSAGATGTPTFSSKVKKIFAVGGVSNINLQAGNNNTIIDASKAGGVSLSGGSKNDKLIGSSNADMYIYGAGKDVIQSFGNGDQISLTAASGNLEESLISAKITKSSSNIKFKFNNNKNTLTVKAEKGTTFTNGQLQINGKTYTYLKNAVQNGGTVSLTSSFGGTFKTSDATQQTIDGGLVKNNLTFVGSTRDEKFIGSNANKKTTFKGGGGADTLVGGESKDTFFYAKSYTGDAEIQSFDFDNDKLKVASGKIGSISTISGGIQIGMTNGQKNSSAIVGSFKITSQKLTDADGKPTAITPDKVAFKANNTYYWFAEDDDKYVSADDGTVIKAGQLITTENRLSALPTDLSTDLKASVIDLNYSTNLAKSGVAIKVKEKTST